MHDLFPMIVTASTAALTTAAALSLGRLQVDHRDLAEEEDRLKEKDAAAAKED